MNATSRAFAPCAVLLASSVALAAEPPPATRTVDSHLGVSFELPADWVEGHSDIPWVQRFEPPSCPPDAVSLEDCPSFLVLQRMQPLSDADAVALSRRRAAAMQPAWRGQAEGVHEGGGAWRVGRYVLGPIDAAHWITNVIDGTVGWELTGWSSPAEAAAMAPVYRAAGASLRVRKAP